MVAILIVTAVIFTSLWACKKDKEFIYVHTKTGNKYRIIQECQMKYKGEWMDAIAYMSIETSQMYIREYNDFILNFKTLSKWKGN